MNTNIDRQARIWGTLCHLSTLLWIPLACLTFFSIPAYFPFLHILAPLVLWQLKKSQHPFIDAQGKESLNFAISLTIYGVIGGIVALVLSFVVCAISLLANPLQGVELLYIPIAIFSVLWLLLIIGQLSLVIFAAIKAFRGEIYKYPYTIRYLQ
jgi:hypothetical protein